ncbi:ISL3 family transposase [Streptomyces caeruleatus]
MRARTRSLAPAPCTGCGTPSGWCHSRYVRRLGDASLGGRPVLIELSVRRLYCENAACGKVTFAEQVPGLTVRYQRRTPLLQRVVEAAGVLLAGRGGARMLRVLNVRLSRCTVLSQLMRMPLPPLVIPRVLGVDDFALYGDTYGTLLVDATTRLPLTLWEGRDAEQLSRWLREHSGVEIVCRDGSRTYRQGITAGAPDAVQVSDRFHMWQGLSRRVQDIASAHRGCLPAALPPAGEADPAPDEETTGDAAADTRAGRHARRLFEAVHALTGSGWSYSAVTRELGLDRRTVRKYARARTWQEVVRRPPRKPSTLDPYRDYLQQRWDEGEHNAMILHQELRTKGYLGHYQRVKMTIAPLRRGLPLDQPRARRPHARPHAGSPPTRTAAAYTSTTACTGSSSTVRNSSTPTTWSAGSPPCSTTVTPHPCRPGSTSSPAADCHHLPASPQPCAKTSTPSPRGSPPPTTPGSTKAASPTSNSKNA